MNTPPPFEETMEFNKTLWPRFREDFAKGNFTQEEALRFLHLHSQEKSIIEPRSLDRYVIFVKIPDHLKEIITLEHAYYIYKEKTDEYEVCLDNEYSHWINKEYFRPCPRDEVKIRSSRRNKNPPNGIPLGGDHREVLYYQARPVGYFFL